MSSISGFDIVFCIFVVLVMIITYKDLQQQIDQLKRCRDIELKTFSYLHGAIEAMRDKVEDLYNKVYELETMMGDNANDNIGKEEPFENPLNIVLCNTQDDEKESSAE